MKAKVECNKKILMDMFLDGDNRHLWDENHEFMETMEQFLLSEQAAASSTPTTTDVEEMATNFASLSDDDKNSLADLVKTLEEKYKFRPILATVQYSSMKSPAPMVVAKRDFVSVCLLAQHVETRTAVLCMSSLDYNLPATVAQRSSSGGYVRGRIICVGIVIKERSDKTDACEFISISMIDLGVYVPPRMIKMFAPQLAQRANEVPKLAVIAKKLASEQPAGPSVFLE